MLKLMGLNCGYNGKKLLEDFNAQISEGNLTALMGLNASGKTTLLKTICGILKPISGRVELDGEDLLALSHRERARKISYMPQMHSIVYGTAVIDIVLMGATPHLGLFDSPGAPERKRAMEMVTLVGMGEKASENFLSLSGGEQQLVLIARSLMQNSKVMLFDEPESSLDYKNKHELLSTIREMVKTQRKVGVITLHDPNLVLNFCDDILLVKDGRILQETRIDDTPLNELEALFSGVYGEVEISRLNGVYVVSKRMDPLMTKKRVYDVESLYSMVMADFRRSGKRNLLITGSKRVGKTTLLERILLDYRHVGKLTSGLLQDSKDRMRAVILFNSHEDPLVVGRKEGSKMVSIEGVFDREGVRLIKEELLGHPEVFVFDEIGYLEKDSSVYLTKVMDVLNNNACIVVLRKDDLAHIRKISEMEDGFIADLDDYQQI